MRYSQLAKRERCPVCHRAVPLKENGYLADHVPGGSTAGLAGGGQPCSGSGGPGKDLRKTVAAEEARRLREQGLALALAQFLLMVDMSDGTYTDGPPVGIGEVLDDASLNEGRTHLQVTCDKGHDVTPWAKLGFIEEARKTLFAAFLDCPQLLEGTALVVTVMPSPPDQCAAYAAILGGPDPEGGPVARYVREGPPRPEAGR